MRDAADGSGAVTPADLSEMAALTWGEVERLDPVVARALVASASPTDLAEHPQASLHLARLCEAGQRLTWRSEALNRLWAALTADGQESEALRREILAERAIDAARVGELDAAESIARGVLAHAAPDEKVSIARATEARGRALAWRGDTASSHQAELLFAEAARAYRTLGAATWEGFITLWSGQVIALHYAQIGEAERRMREGIEIAGPDSPRRPSMLTYLAEALNADGRFDEASALLDEGIRLATTSHDELGIAYGHWSRASQASMRGDLTATVREIEEVSRSPGDWFATPSGTTFLAEAAEMLDRAGDSEAARRYLSMAVDRNPDDELVLGARAALLARHGDPVEALAQLRRLVNAPWFERRMLWRHSLLTAYALLRAGRDGAAEMAVRAFEQAQSMGGTHLAATAEPDIVAALAPLAAATGSGLAQELLGAAHGPLIRLLGHDSVLVDGASIRVPTGKAGSLLRLLAVHPAGLDADAILEALWPEEEGTASRKQLRDVSFRLRRAVGTALHRDGDRLHLATGWVDVTRFLELADRAHSTTGPRRANLALGALALWSGPPVPAEPYADWAIELRTHLRITRLSLLDVLAEEAGNRNAHAEAVGHLGHAIADDPYNEDRYLLLARHLIGQGRPATARAVLDQAVAALAETGLRPPRSLLELRAQTVPPHDTAVDREQL